VLADLIYWQPEDFKRMDESTDDQFYTSPRFVNHIDDQAIAALKNYYEQALPHRGRILDLCSSWVSHFSPELDDAVSKKELQVTGVGMNKRELEANQSLTEFLVRDLNTVDNPCQGLEPGYDAVTCVVSIDYMTKPLELLHAVNKVTAPGGRIHLAISNRCFPTKAVGRWLKLNEDQRLNMVGDYLWFSGWKEPEIVTLKHAAGWTDPLWIVTAVKAEDTGKSEL